jgi:hypothetical protein
MAAMNEKVATEAALLLSMVQPDHEAFAALSFNVVAVY